MSGGSITRQIVYPRSITLIQLDILPTSMPGTASGISHWDTWLSQLCFCPAARSAQFAPGSYGHHESPKTHLRWWNYTGRPSEMNPKRWFTHLLMLHREWMGFCALPIFTAYRWGGLCPQCPRMANHGTGQTKKPVMSIFGAHQLSWPKRPWRPHPMTYWLNNIWYT